MRDEVVKAAGLGVTLTLLGAVLFIGVLVFAAGRMYAVRFFDNFSEQEAAAASAALNSLEAAGVREMPTAALFSIIARENGSIGSVTVLSADKDDTHNQSGEYEDCTNCGGISHPKSQHCETCPAACRHCDEFRTITGCKYAVYETLSYAANGKTVSKSFGGWELSGFTAAQGSRINSPEKALYAVRRDGVNMIDKSITGRVIVSVKFAPARGGYAVRAVRTD